MFLTNVFLHTFGQDSIEGWNSDEVIYLAGTELSKHYTTLSWKHLDSRALFQQSELGESHPVSKKIIQLEKDGRSAVFIGLETELKLV